MAKSKVKEPKVAIKGEKKSEAPKASVTARAKPSQLSEEAVLESGSESESGTSGGDSDTESEAEKRQNTKKPNEKKVKATEPLDVPVPSDDSSDDSSSEEDDKKAKKSSKKDKKDKKDKKSKKDKKETPKANGVKRKSEESSSDDSDDELPDAPESKKPRTDLESSEEESSSEDEPQADKMDVDKPAPPPASTTITSVTAKPFDAPAGYKSLDSSSRSALSNADLQGKQVWHITAPADLPISSLTEVALDSIQSGKPVLSHKGVDYVMSEDKGAQTGNATLVLLPEKDGYKPTSQSVSKTLHIRQQVVLPNLSEKQVSNITGGNAAGDVARAAVTAVRPQPRGMKMRYRPPGFGSGDPGRIGSDSEDEPEPRGKENMLQFPKAPEATGSKKDKKEKKDKKDKKEKKSKSKA